VDVDSVDRHEQNNIVLKYDRRIAPAWSSLATQLRGWRHPGKCPYPLDRRVLVFWI